MPREDAVMLGGPNLGPKKKMANKPAFHRSPMEKRVLQKNHREALAEQQRLDKEKEADDRKRAIALREKRRKEPGPMLPSSDSDEFAETSDKDQVTDMNDIPVPNPQLGCFIEFLGCRCIPRKVVTAFFQHDTSRYTGRGLYKATHPKMSVDL